MIRALASCGLVTAAALIAGTADAQSYNLSYSTGSGAFSGVLTIGGAADANGFYAITGLTGTHDGAAVSLIPAGDFPAGTDQPNDNLFRPSPNYLDVSGFSYAAGGFNYNVYFVSGSRYNECSDPSAQCRDGYRYLAINNFTVTQADAAVPEPATWGLMIAGFGLVGGTMRRRRARVAFA